MSYTLAALRKIYEKKYFFTKERFFHYFTILGNKKEEIDEYFRLWNRFPNYTDEDMETADCIIQKIMAYPFKDNSLPGSYRFGYKHKPNKKRVYYQNDDAIISFEVDLNEADEIILYAEFLKRKPEVIVTVDFIEELTKGNERIRVFDGDVFSTSETWDRRRDGEIIMCYGGPYRKLLYTRGKGYIRNGKPDLDEEEYSSYVLTGKDNFRFFGNAYADPSFLVDSDVPEGDNE